MADLRPNTGDIAFNVQWYLDTRHLSPPEFAAVMRIMAHYAIKRVWTYTPPSDEGVVDNDKTNARVAGLSLSSWTNIKPVVLEFFDVRDGFLHPKRHWFSVLSPGAERPAISAAIRSAVLKRDDFRCMYCGTSSGPFDIDHIIPISRGGVADDIENLITACSSCNRSKGAKTPEEWLK